MATRYKYAVIWGMSCTNELLEVGIYGPTYQDEIVNLTGADNMCVITHSRDENNWMSDTMMIAEIGVRWINDGASSEGIINAIVNGEEGDFCVAVVRDIEGDNELLITGVINPDTLTVEMGCNGVVNMRAFDGLRTLKNYNTHIPTDPFAANFYRMMHKLPNFDNFYPSTAQSVFFSPQFTVTSAANQVFLDVAFERQFENDFDYLNAVLNDLLLMLVHTNGYWYMVGLKEWAVGSISGTWYKEQSYTAISSSTLNYTTYSPNVDEGALRRFTRPYGIIQLNYSPEGQSANAQATIAHSPAVDNYNMTVVNDAIFGRPAKDFMLRVDYYTEITKNTGSTSHVNYFSFNVQYGSKYYDGVNKAWTTSSSVYAHSFNNTGTSENTVGGFGFFELPIGLAGITNATLIVRAIYNVNIGTANVITNTYAGLTFTGSAQESIVYTDGTTGSVLSGTMFFADNYTPRINGMFSFDLNAYTGNSWSNGVTTNFLQNHKAAALKENLSPARTLYECFIDDNHGPLAFYDILGNTALPVYCQQNVLRLEGNIVALSV
jgi:hypothetical protein